MAPIGTYRQQRYAPDPSEFEPEQKPVPLPRPDDAFTEPKVVQGPQGDPGPAGPQGPQGKPGRDGVDGRTPSDEQIRSIVNEWLEENRESLRGERGPQGERGPAGPQGRPGVSSGSSAPAESSGEDRRILYFTSTKGCPNCSATDKTVERLKAQGYPITVIDLDPTQTEIRGVPRIHIPREGRDVAGQSNVSTYLGLLVP